MGYKYILYNHNIDATNLKVGDKIYILDVDIRELFDKYSNGHKLYNIKYVNIEEIEVKHIIEDEESRFVGDSSWDGIYYESSYLGLSYKDRKRTESISAKLLEKECYTEEEIKNIVGYYN